MPLRRQYNSLILGIAALLLACGIAISGTGCGGGGNGGNGNGGGSATTVIGRVLRAETNLPPNPAATVTIAGRSVTTGGDGRFSIANVPISTKTAVIKAASTADRTVALTLTKGVTNDIGDVFVSDTGYTASVTGTVVSPTGSTNTPVGGAKVTIAGVTVLTSTDGKFQIDNLPVGLGQDPNASIGTISATGFDDKQIFTQFPLEKSPPVNSLGTLPLGAPISGSAPGLPYTVKLTVKKGSTPTAGLAMNIFDSVTNTNLGGPLAQSGGDYYFWVVPGTYNIIVQADSTGTNTITQAVTLPGAATPVNVTLQL